MNTASGPFLAQSRVAFVSSPNISTQRSTSAAHITLRTEMASPRPPAKPLDLEVTVISAKHLKNVNWRHGDLKPYAVVYLDPDRRAATKPDDFGSIKPVWNEGLTLPLPLSHPDPSPLLLTIDIFHSKPSETPKPLVGTARAPLKDLIDADDLAAAAALAGASTVRTLELRRPSGRPHGKVRITLAIRERPSPPDPNYHIPPPSGYYYSSAPPPPPPSARDYRIFSSPPPPYSNPIPQQPSQYPYGNYSDPYYSSTSGYYSSATGYYSAPPAPVPARPYYDRASGYGGPSAPVDYSSGPSSYEQKPKGGRLGMGPGLAVGAVAGVLGGLALEEGLKHEEEKITERVESDLAARDDYSDYRADY